MPATLEVRDLTVHHGDIEALSGVTLTVAEGTALAIIGPNGSGKSTLLRAIAGILKPTSGHVSLPHGVTPAFVLQSTDVDRSLPISVRDTVATARYASLGLFRRFGPDDRDVVTESMERLEVADLAGRQLHDLSGGQRQRVLVAQGIAQESPLLLLDEPVTGLDLVSRQLIFGVMDEELAAGRIVLMSTHNLEDARRCDQVLLLSGAPVAIGSPDQVLRDEHLQVAYKGRFLRVGEQLLLDDPHHVH